VSQSSVRLLSTLSKLPEAELARRLDQLKDPTTGKVKALATLEAALVASTGGMKQATLDAYGALSTRAQTPHVIEEPDKAFTRASPTAGYAAATAEPPSPQVKNLLEKAGLNGVKRAQQSGLLDEGALKGAMNGFPGAKPVPGSPEADLRQIHFEQLKDEMNKITQAQQMMTNVLNTMHEQAMTAIRNSKA
jgi:hypothetical protein